MLDWKIMGGIVARTIGVDRADIGIAEGRIVEIGDLTHVVAAEVFDAAGFHILPGAIDTQVHFREPGLEWKEDLGTGSASAAAGGVTTFFEMPNTNPATTTLERLEDKLRRAHGRCSANYAFFCGASSTNIQELRQLEQSPGSAGIKLFMGSSTGDLLVPDDETIEKVMRAGSRPMPVHAEDEDRLKQRKSAFHNPSVLDHPEIRDTESARLATQRLMDLVRKTSRPTHILHVSTADEVPLIAGAKREGLPVTAEVTPQHLWFAAPEAYTKLGSLAQMNPPIRGSAHREALWDGLRSGIFDVFGSDHAPHTLEEKAQAYPNSPSGMTGVQTFLPVLLTFVARGDLSLEQVVAMTSERPANLYGVASRGRIELGYWADLAIVDIHRRFKVEREWIKSKAGWSPYEGIELTGWPEETFVSGRPADPSAGRMVEFEWKASG